MSKSFGEIVTDGYKIKYLSEEVGKAYEKAQRRKIKVWKYSITFTVAILIAVYLYWAYSAHRSLLNEVAQLKQDQGRLSKEKFATKLMPEKVKSIQELIDQGEPLTNSMSSMFLGRRRQVSRILQSAQFQMKEMEHNLERLLEEKLTQDCPNHPRRRSRGMRYCSQCDKEFEYWLEKGGKICTQ